MTLEFDTVTGTDVAGLIDGLARLRGIVFREWPYLYDIDPGYERRYLADYSQDGAIVVLAKAQGALVGASTGMPISNHSDDLSTALVDYFPDLRSVFYCAESVLLSDFRGQGAGHRFFELREGHAAELGFTHSVFCAVKRPDDHPDRPRAHRPLDAFWSARGYRRLGVDVSMSWRDIGSRTETEKTMEFWGRTL